MERDNLKLNTYKISSDHTLLDKVNHITPEVRRILEGLRPDVEKGRKYTIKKVNKLCLKYPRVPVLKNILSTIYQQNGNTKQAFAVNQWLVREHPDYLFGKINLAAELLLKDEPEKIPEILGDAMEIGHLYPQRKEFHIEEVVGFYNIAVQYFLAIDDVESAEIRVEILEDIDDEHPKTLNAISLLRQHNLNKAAARFEEEKKQRKTVKLTDSRSHLQTTKPPEFHFPQEIGWLYNHDLGIDREKIAQILKLDPVKLTEDLEKMLQDSIARFNFFIEKVNEEKYDYQHIDFPVHALLLLAKLKSEQSLPQVLQLLKQDEDFIDFWFGDFLNLLIEDVLYHCGKHKTEVIFEFLKQPNIYHFNKAVVGEALVKIIENSEEKRQIFIEEYRRVLEVFIENSADENYADTEFLGFIISDVVDLGYKELLPEIKKLMDLGIVNLFICGTNEAVERDIKVPIKRYSTNFFENSIFEKYEELFRMETEAGDSTLNEDIYTDNYNQEIIKRNYIADDPGLPVTKPDKIGRNDPCPCGSGKKYKKCCLNG